MQRRFFVFGLLVWYLSNLTTLVAAGSLLPRNWDIDGVTREALVHLPEGNNSKSKPSPVVFAFHGHGGTMKYAARTFHIETVWPEAIVVYMQGLNTPGHLTDPDGKKPGWQRVVGDQGDRDLKFFDAVLASLKKDYKVDEKRIYSTGHSNGGAFTYLLWQTRGEQFAAFAPSASLLPPGVQRGTTPAFTQPKTDKNPSGIFPGPGFTTNALKGQWSGMAPNDKPIFHVAGENDELVKFDWQKLFLEKLRKQNDCAEGTPWKKDKRCTVYKSKTGGDITTYIHPGTHKYPEEAPELIAKFFKDQVRK